MKCSNHAQAEARAVCVYCGAGICSECAEKTHDNRYVCSPECANSLAKRDYLLATLREKTLAGHRVTGFFCCAAALLPLFFAAHSLKDHQWDALALQLAAALGLFLSGFFYLRLAVVRRRP